MENKKLFLSLLLIIALSMNEALRILVVFPGASKSHSILGHAVVNHFLAAGHEVVHVTTYPSEKIDGKLKEIPLPRTVKWFRSLLENTEDFKLKNLMGKGNVGSSLMIYYIMYELHKRIFKEEEFINLLSDPKEKFDAVIVEWFFQDMPAGISPMFECPHIWFGSTEASWQLLQLVDDIPNPSYNVDLFSANTLPLSFLERLEELWELFKRYVAYTAVFTPLDKWLYNSVFSEIATKRGVAVPSYNEAVYNGSFLLINSHPSIGAAFRLPQNAKYIGGYHVERKIKPLPKDLQTLMDGAKHGVIYFSMGSNLRSIDMSDAMKVTLLNMFGKLKQTLIWKFETNLENVPANVHLVKWAPQQSILAHPNLKMFITHGGRLSTIEAIHYAVPVIGIPIAADQHVNMALVTDKGFGVSVELSENIAVDLHAAIQKLLQNNRYKEMAEMLSLIYHDRPDPGKELVYWVEHVVKTGGAPHLKSPALSLPFYQKYYLDLLALLILIFVVSKIIIKKLKSKLKSQKPVVTKQKKTK